MAGALMAPFLTTVLAMALALGIASDAAQAAQDSSEREQAESKLGAVTREISKLREQLESSRADHQAEQARLREVDLAIQKANLEMRELETLQRDHERQLAELERERDAYLASLDQRRDELADQIRTAYRLSGQSRIKLVLNQDDPALLSRMLAYYDYLNRARVYQIDELTQALETLDRLQQPINRELERLAEVQNLQREVLQQLQGQRQNRAALLAELSGKIGSEQARLRELERNRKDLQALIERLADALADIPADLGSRTGIARQKGRLPMPVKGPVRAAYGQQRGSGLNWQGWLIGAPAGTEVNAVAYGRVAFADWLRGYGLLIIIDHGQGYLSLYAHNESLLREAGAWVEAGEIISIVGDNPGSGQGLYFELRKNGDAVDPAAWLRR